MQQFGWKVFQAAVFAAVFFTFALAGMDSADRGGGSTQGQAIGAAILFAYVVSWMVTNAITRMADWLARRRVMRAEAERAKLAGDAKELATSNRSRSKLLE